MKTNPLTKLKNIYSNFKIELISTGIISIILLLFVIIIRYNILPSTMLDGTFLIGALALPFTAISYITSKNNDFHTQSLKQLEEISSDNNSSPTQIKILQLCYIFNQGSKGNKLFIDLIQEAYIRILFNGTNIEKIIEETRTDSQKLNHLEKAIKKIIKRNKMYSMEVNNIISEEEIKQILRKYNIVFEENITKLEKNFVYYKCKIENLNSVLKNNEPSDSDENIDSIIIDSEIYYDSNSNELQEFQGIISNTSLLINDDSMIISTSLKSEESYAEFKINQAVIKDEITNSEILFTTLEVAESTDKEIRNAYSSKGYVAITGDTIEGKVRWFKISNNNYEKNIDRPYYFFYKVKDSTYRAIMFDNFNFKKIIEEKIKDSKDTPYAIDKNGNYNFYFKLTNNKTKLIDYRFNNSKKLTMNKN